MIRPRDAAYALEVECYYLLRLEEKLKRSEAIYVDNLKPCRDRIWYWHNRLEQLDPLQPGDSMRLLDDLPTL